MNYSTLNESLASVCLGIIERNAPRLMRIGGGPLVRDMEFRHSATSGRHLPPERVAEIVALLRQGKTQSQVALEGRVGAITVSRIAERHGIVMAKRVYKKAVAS